MPFSIKSPSRLKRVAKTLASELKSRDVEGFPYHRCLDVASRMYGYASFLAASAECSKAPPSLDDGMEVPEVVAARRREQIAALIAEGIARGIAEAVTDAVRPTDRADGRTADLFERTDFADRTPAAAVLATSAVRRRLFALNLSTWGMPDHQSSTLTTSCLLRLLDGNHGLLVPRREFAAYRGLASIAMLDLHEEGLTIENFAAGMVSALRDALASGPDADASEAASLLRQATYRDCILTERAARRLAECADMLQYGTAMRNAVASGGNKPAEFVGEVFEDFARMMGSDVSLAQLASAAAWSDFAVIPLSGDRGSSKFATPLDLKPLYRGRKDVAAAFPLLSPSECDAEMVRAVAEVESKGTPKLFLDNEGAAFSGGGGGIDDMFFVRPDGSAAMATDVLLSAERAGLTLHDVIDAILLATRFSHGMIDGPEFVMVNDRPAWNRFMKTLPKPRGPVSPDLVAAVLCFELVPWWMGDVEEFTASLDGLRRLAEIGRGPSVIAGTMHGFYPKVAEEEAREMLH